MGDPGVQPYGSGALFTALRDECDKIFMSLPPPKPSRDPSAQRMSSAAYTRSYYNSSNPCFSPDSLVLMGDGSTKPCADIVFGDVLATDENFIDVTPYYTKNNFFDPLTRKYRLLTPRERHLIDPKVGVDSKGAVNDVFVWLNAALQLAFDYGELTAFEKNDLNATLLEQHSALITIWNWIDQPLPFSYVNLVIVVVTLYNFLYGMLKALQAVDKDMWSLPFFA